LILKPLKLSATVKHYPWGKLGQDSIVCSLMQGAGELSNAEEKPFAELWVGTHSGGQSKILNVESNPFLGEMIASNPEQILGESVAKNFGEKLPFMFKILSIGRALSIQAHPDKELASKLHKQNPEFYPDTNHKPELGIALTKASLLYGFLNHEEIIENFKTVPELKALFEDLFNEVSKSKDPSTQKQFLKKLIQELFLVNQSRISECSKALYLRLEKQGHLSERDDKILKLKEKYQEGDRGLWFFFILNFVSLNPGEAIFIAPNEPHAYLEGDVAECMASSDNVVRAGLTDKPIDIEVLKEMLTYQHRFPEIIRSQPLKEQPEIKSYLTECSEFVVGLIEDKSNRTIFSKKNSLEFYFCFSGEGKFICEDDEYLFKAGESYLIPAYLDNYQLNFSGGKLFKITIPQK
jgi:mannose-6-phosphate isomerase